MNETDKTLIQLMNDGFSSLRSDMNSELKSIKDDVTSIKDDVNNELKSINTELAEIKVKMSSVNKQIFGNGKKGLADRVADLEVALSSGGLIWKAVVNFVAWVVTTAIALYAVLK